MAKEPIQRIGNKFGQGIHDTYEDGSSQSRSMRMQNMANRDKQRAEEALARSAIRPGSLTGAASFTTGEISQATRMAYQRFIQDANQYLTNALSTTPSGEGQEFLRRKHSMMVAAIETAFNSGRLFQEARRLAGNIAMQGSVAATVASTAQPGRKMVVLEQASQGAIGFILANSLPIQGQINSQSTAWPQHPQHGPAMPAIPRQISPTPMQLQFPQMNPYQYPRKAPKTRMVDPIPPRSQAHHDLQARIARGEVVSNPIIESFPGALTNNLAHRQYGYSAPGGQRRYGSADGIDPRTGKPINYVGPNRSYDVPVPRNIAPYDPSVLAKTLEGLNKPVGSTGPGNATELQGYIDKLDVLSREPMLDARDRRRIQHELSETKVALARMRVKSGVSPTKPAMRQIAAASSASVKDARDAIELSTGGNVWATASRRAEIGPHTRLLGLVPSIHSPEQAAIAVRRQAIYERVVGGRLQGSDYDRAKIARPTHGTAGFFSEQTSASQLYARSATTTNVNEGGQSRTDYTQANHDPSRAALALKFVLAVNKNLGPGEQPLPTSGFEFSAVEASFNAVAGYERRVQQFQAPAGVQGVKSGGHGHDSMQEKRALHQISASLPPIGQADIGYLNQTLGSQLGNIKEVMSFSATPIDTTGRRNVPKQVFPSKAAVQKAYRAQKFAGLVDVGLKAVEREDGEIGLGLDPNVDHRTAERLQREIYLRESLKRLETSQRDWERQAAAGKISQSEAISRQTTNKAGQSELINKMMDGWSQRRKAVEAGTYDWAEVMRRSEPSHDNNVNDIGYRETYGDDESRVGEQAVDSSVSSLMQMTNQWSGFDPIENPYEMKGAIQTPEQHRVMARQVQETNNHIEAQYARYEKISNELERMPAGGPATSAKRRMLEDEMQTIELSFAQYTDPKTGEFRPGTMISGLSAPEMAARFGRRAERPVHSSYVNELEMGSAYTSAKAYAEGISEDIARERISQSNPDSSLTGVGYGVEFLKAGAMGRLKIAGDRLMISDLGGQTPGEQFRTLDSNIRSQTEGFDSGQQDRMVSGWLSANGFHHAGPFNPILSVMYDQITNPAMDFADLRRSDQFTHLENVTHAALNRNAVNRSLADHSNMGDSNLKQRLNRRRNLRANPTDNTMSAVDFMGIMQSRAAGMDRHVIDGWLAEEQRLLSKDKARPYVPGQGLEELRKEAFDAIMEPYVNDLPAKRQAVIGANVAARISDEAQDFALRNGGNETSHAMLWQGFGMPIAAMVGTMGYRALDSSKGHGLFEQDPLKAKVPSDRLVRNQGHMLEALLFPNDKFMNLETPGGQALAAIRADQGLGNPHVFARAQQIKKSMATIEELPIEDILGGLTLSGKQPDDGLSKAGLVSFYSNQAAAEKKYWSGEITKGVPAAKGRLEMFINTLDKTPLGRWMLLNDEHDSTWRLYNREVETRRRPAHRIHQLTQAMGDWYHDLSGGGLPLGDEVAHPGLLDDDGMSALDIHRELARERSDPNRSGFYYPLEKASPRMNTFIQGYDPDELHEQMVGNATGTRGPPDPLLNRTLSAAAFAAAFEAIGGQSRDGYSISAAVPAGRLNEISIDDSLSKLNQKRRDGRQDWLHSEMLSAIQYGSYKGPYDLETGEIHEDPTKAVGAFANTIRKAWLDEGGANRKAVMARTASNRSGDKAMSAAVQKGLATKANNTQDAAWHTSRLADTYEKYLAETGPIPFAMRMLEGQSSTSERRGHGLKGIETVSQARQLGDVQETLVREYLASQKAQEAARQAGKPLPPIRFSKDALANMVSVFNLDEAGAWEAGFEGNIEQASAQGYELASSLIGKIKGTHADVTTSPAYFGGKKDHRSARSSQPYADATKSDGKTLASSTEWLNPDTIKEFGLEQYIARQNDAQKKSAQKWTDFLAAGNKGTGGRGTPDAPRNPDGTIELGTPFRRADSNLMQVWLPQPSDRPRAYTPDELATLAEMADPNVIGSAMHSMLGDERLANNEWASQIPGFGGKDVFDKLQSVDPTMDRNEGFFKRSRTARGAVDTGRGSLWGNPFAKGMPHPDDYDKTIRVQQGGELYEQWLRNPNDPKWKAWQNRINASENKGWIANTSVMSRYNEIRERSGELEGRRVFCPGCRGRGDFCHLCGGSKVFAEWAQIDRESMAADEMNELANISDPSYIEELKQVNRQSGKLSDEARVAREIARLSEHGRTTGEVSLTESSLLSRDAIAALRAQHGSVRTVAGAGVLNMVQQADGSWSHGDDLDVDPEGYKRGRELRQMLMDEITASGVPIPVGMSVTGMVDQIMGKPSIAPLEGFGHLSGDDESDMVMRAFGHMDKILGKGAEPVDMNPVAITQKGILAQLLGPQSGQANVDFATGGLAGLAGKAWGGLKNWWLNHDSQVMGISYRHPKTGRFMSAADYTAMMTPPAAPKGYAAKIPTAKRGVFRKGGTAPATPGQTINPAALLASVIPSAGPRQYTHPEDHPETIAEIDNILAGLYRHVTQQDLFDPAGANALTMADHNKWVPAHPEAAKGHHWDEHQREFLSKEWRPDTMPHVLSGAGGTGKTDIIQAMITQAKTRRRDGGDGMAANRLPMMIGFANTTTDNIRKRLIDGRVLNDQDMEAYEKSHGVTTFHSFAHRLQNELGIENVFGRTSGGGGDTDLHGFSQQELLNSGFVEFDSSGKLAIRANQAWTQRPRQASGARDIETFREALHEIHSQNLGDVLNQAETSIPLVRDANGKMVVRRGINQSMVDINGVKLPNFRDEDRQTMALEKDMSTNEERLWKMVKNLGESGFHPDELTEYFDPRSGHAHESAGELHYLAATVLKQMDAFNQRGALIRSEDGTGVELTRYHSSWDVVAKPLQYMRDNPNAATKLDNFWGRRMILDEAQDANIGQLMLMAGTTGDWGNIALLGDLKQEIYGWRGGSRSLLQRAIQGASKRNTYTDLTTNFRLPEGKVNQLNALTDNLKFATREHDAATGVTSIEKHRLLPANPSSPAMKKDAAGNILRDASGNPMPIQPGGGDVVIPIRAFDTAAGPKTGGGKTFQYQVMADLTKTFLGMGGIHPDSEPYLRQAQGVTVPHAGKIMIPTKTNAEAAEIALEYKRQGLPAVVNFSKEKVKQWSEMSDWLAAEGGGRFADDAAGDMELAQTILNEPKLKALLDPEFQLGVTDPTIASSSTQDKLQTVLKDIQKYRDYISLRGTHTEGITEHELATSARIGTAFTLKGGEADIALIPNMSEGQFEIETASSIEKAAENSRSLYVLLSRAKSNYLLWPEKTVNEPRTGRDDMHSVARAMDEYNTTGVMPEILAMSKRGRAPEMMELALDDRKATLPNPAGGSAKAGLSSAYMRTYGGMFSGDNSPLASQMTNAPKRRSLVTEFKKLFTKGDRFADGGATKDELALIGEKGREVYWDPSENKFLLANEPMLIEAKKGGFVLNEQQLRDRGKRAPRRPALATGGKLIDNSGYSSFVRFDDKQAYGEFLNQAKFPGANVHGEEDTTTGDWVARVNYKNEKHAGLLIPHLQRNVLEHSSISGHVKDLGTVPTGLLSRGTPVAQSDIAGMAGITDSSGVASKMGVISDALQKFGKTLGTTTTSVEGFDKRAKAALDAFGDITTGTVKKQFDRMGVAGLARVNNTGVQHDELAYKAGAINAPLKHLGTGFYGNQDFQPAGLGRHERLNSETGQIEGLAGRAWSASKRAGGAAGGGMYNHIQSMGTGDSRGFRSLNEAVGNTFFTIQNVAQQMGNYADQSMQYADRVEQGKIQSMTASGYRPEAGSSHATYGRYFDSMDSAYNNSANIQQYRDLGITQEIYNTSLAAGAAASGNIGLDGVMLDEMKSIDKRMETGNELQGDAVRYAELQHKSEQQIDRVAGELSKVGLWGEQNGMGAQAAIRQVMITGQQSGISMEDQAKEEHSGYWMKSLGITQTLANQSPAGPEAFMEAAQYSANVVIPLLDANYKDAGFSDEEWGKMSTAEQSENLSFIRQTKYGEMVNDLLKGGQEGGAAGRTLRQLVDSQLDSNPRQSMLFAQGQGTMDLNGRPIIETGRQTVANYNGGSLAGSVVSQEISTAAFDMSTTRAGHFDANNNYIGGNLPSSDPNTWNFWTQRENNAFGIANQRGAIAQADIMAGYTSATSYTDGGEQIITKTRDQGFDFGGQTYHGQLAIEAQSIELTGKQINFQMETNGWQIPFAQQSLAAGYDSLAAGKASAAAGASLSRAELEESRTQLNARVGMTGMRETQFETGQQMAQNDLARQQRSMMNSRWMEDTMYGTPGSDQSYKAYAAYNRAQLEQGQGAQNAGATNSLIPTNVMGLENQMGYRSLENQRAMMTYGQSSLSGAAQYEEQMDFLKFQEDYMGKKVEVTGENRKTERQIQDEALADQKKALEVNQQLQRAMFEEEERQLRAQIGLLDLRGTKNEADIAGSYASIAAQEISMAQQAKSISMMEQEAVFRAEELAIQQQSNDMQKTLLPEKAAEEERSRAHLTAMLPLMVGANEALLIWTRAMGGFVGLAEGMNAEGINASGYQTLDQMLESTARFSHEFPAHIQAIVAGLTGSVQALPGVIALLDGVWDRLTNGYELAGGSGENGSMMDKIRSAVPEAETALETRRQNDVTSANNRILFDASRAMTNAAIRLSTRGSAQDPLYVQMKQFTANANSEAAGFGGAFAPGVELAGNLAVGVWGATKVAGGVGRWMTSSKGPDGTRVPNSRGSRWGKAAVASGIVLGGKMLWDHWRGNDKADASEAPWMQYGMTQEEWTALPAQEREQYEAQIAQQEATQGGGMGQYGDMALTAVMMAPGLIPGLGKGVSKLAGKMGGAKGILKGGAMGLGLGIGGNLLDAGLGKMGVDTNGALGTIGTAAGMGAMFGPWGALAGAGVGLGIVGYQNREAIGKWAGAHGMGVSDLKGYGTSANAWAEEHGMGVEDIKGYATAGWDKAKAFWSWLSDLDWNGIKEMIAGIPGKLKESFVGVWETITDGDALSGVVLDFFSKITAPFDNLIDKLPGGEFVTDMIGTLFTGVVEIWAEIQSFILGSFGSILGFLRENWNDPMAILQGVWDTIQGVFTGAKEWVTENAPDIGAEAMKVLGMVGEKLTLATDWFGDLNLGGAAHSAIKVVTDIFDGAVGFIGERVDDVNNAAGSLIDGVIGVFNSVVKHVNGIIPDWAYTIPEIDTTKAPPVEAQTVELSGPIMVDVSTVAFPEGQDPASMIAAGMSQAISIFLAGVMPTDEWTTEQRETIQTQMGALVTGFGEHFDPTAAATAAIQMMGMVKGMGDVFQRVMDSGVFDEGYSGMHGALKSLFNALQGAIDAASGVIYSANQKVGGPRVGFTPLARGTMHSKDGWALLGEAGAELVTNPDGTNRIIDHETLLNLKAGTRVFNAAETRALMGNTTSELVYDKIRSLRDNDQTEIGGSAFSISPALDAKMSKGSTRSVTMELTINAYPGSVVDRAMVEDVVATAIDKLNDELEGDK